MFIPIPGACGAGGAGKWVDVPPGSASLCSPLQSWFLCPVPNCLCASGEEPCQKQEKSSEKPWVTWAGQTPSFLCSIISSLLSVGCGDAEALSKHFSSSLTGCICFKSQPGAISSIRLPLQAALSSRSSLHAPAWRLAAACMNDTAQIPSTAHEEGVFPTLQLPRVALLGLRSWEEKSWDSSARAGVSQAS